MRENFRAKQRGDSLSARDINTLNNVAGRIGRFSVGPHMKMKHGDSFLAVDGPKPWNQYQLLITDDHTVEDTYVARRRYYDHSELIWKTQTDAVWYVDGTSLGGAKILIGDQLVCFYDTQRNMFIPCWVPTERLGRVTEELGIAPGGSGEITLYDADKTPTTVTLTGYHTWMLGSDPLAKWDEVAVGYRTNANGVGRYIITNASCATS